MTESNITVEQILSGLQANHSSEKVASAPQGSPLPQKQALDAAYAAFEESTKTASAAPSAGHATAYLEKTAAQIESAEAESLIKEANLFGAAMMDSFIARGNEYAKHASVATQPEALVQAQPPVEAHVKTAAAQGAHDAGVLIQNLLQAKTAAETPTVEASVKTAAAQGAADVQKVLAHLQAPAEKVATRQQGVDDSLEKIAELCQHAFNRGIQHVEALVS